VTSHTSSLCHLSLSNNIIHFSHFYPIFNKSGTGDMVNKKVIFAPQAAIFFLCGIMKILLEILPWANPDPIGGMGGGSASSPFPAENPDGPGPCPTQFFR